MHYVEASLVVVLVLAVGCERKKETSETRNEVAKGTPQEKSPVKPHTATEDRAPAPRCNGKPCLAVPTGLKGLRFGMMKQQVTDVLNVPLREGTPRKMKPADPLGEKHAIAVPGRSFKARTTFGGEAAECRIEFDDAELLAAITCTTRHGGWRSANAAGAELEARLREKYGPPKSKKRDRATWLSAEARLRLSTYGNTVIIENLSSSHLSAIDATNRRADENWKGHLEEKARKLKEGGDELDRDLGGPAEVPASPR